MGDVSRKTVKQIRHFMFNNFFLLKNFAVYEIMWKNMVEPDRLQWQHNTRHFLFMLHN